MSMGHPSTQPNIQTLQPEYIIYSFLKQEGQRGGDNWMAMGVSHDIEQARAKAKALFQSARYTRIELRKKFVSERTGAVMDIPLEVFGQSPDRDIRQIQIFLALALFCAMAAMAISLWL